jgi:hypothetical protein
VDIEVNDAILIEDKKTGTQIWQVTYTADGQSYSHVFPHSTFHWRVAEYGLDPDDVHGLLEAILYEWHVEIDPDHPQSLGNAPTIADAKAAYLARIASKKSAGQLRDRKRKKTDPRMIDPNKTRGWVIVDNETDPDTPLAMIKRHVVIDPDTVTAMRGIVAEQRARHQATRD